MTDNATSKPTRMTRQALHVFIAETEAERNWHESGVPDVWNELREFAGLDALTRKSLIERKIEEATRRLQSAEDDAEKKTYRASLIDLLRALQFIEDREKESADKP